MVTEQLWLKKNSPWLIPFHMALATYCYYEKVRRTMRTAIVSHLLNVENEIANKSSATFITFESSNLLTGVTKH